MAAIVPALSAVSLAGLLFTVASTALRGLTVLAGRLASIAVTDTGYILQYTSQSDEYCATTTYLCAGEKMVAY